MALNHDLIPELESRGKMLQIPLKIMDLGAFCVELIMLLQKKNFGPNVIYFVLRFSKMHSLCSLFSLGGYNNYKTTTTTASWWHGGV